jgi:diguanylate cyclase (GGDEF)-like protein
MADVVDVAADSPDLEALFWRGHIRLGAASTAVCSAMGLSYAMATPTGPHRLAVIVVGLIALASAPLIVTRPVTAVLTGSGRAPWLYGWSASLLLAVTAAVLLDGGGRSPLTALFAASLVFTAVGFGRSGAVVMGTAGVGCYLLTCLSGSPGGWPVALTACALVLITATCAVTAGRLRAALAEQAHLSQQLRESAARDGLTGCLNHRAFVERLDEEIGRARRTRTPLGFVTLDLDDFKRVNDTYGHVIADELLTAIGFELRRSARAGDVVGRLGGDEFAIVAPNSDGDATILLASRIKAALEAVGADLEVGVSVGTSLLQEEYDGRELRRRADDALYDAKGHALKAARR